MIDFTKIRIGDTVTAEGTVVENDGSEDMPLRVTFRGEGTVWMSKRSIKSHTPKPKSLTVGDTVGWRTDTKPLGKVLMVHEPHVWIWLFGANEPATYLLDDLSLLP